MKKNLLFILLIVALNPAIAQWTKLNVGTTQSLKCVDYYSADTIWIGALNKIIKSNNGGTTWASINAIYDSLGNPMPSAEIQDIELINSNEAIADGYFNSGNSEMILKTFNGALNWNRVYYRNSNLQAAGFHALDRLNNSVIAVGNSGRLALSSNNGNSWTATTLASIDDLIDVKYATTDTIYSVGWHNIIQSANAGNSWTPLPVSHAYHSVSCDKNVVYAIDNQTNSTMLKSTNYGVNYSAIILPFSSPKQVHAINKYTLIVSATTGIFISKSGGKYWEKFVLTNYQSVNRFDFLNDTTGIGVGDAGYVLKTTSLFNAPSLAIPRFKIAGNPTYCIGTSVSFTNLTDSLPNYTYQWKVNGLLVSTQYNFILPLSIAGHDTISLTVNNGYGSSIQQIVIQAIVPSIIPISSNLTRDSICPSNFVGVKVVNSILGAIYRLRKGYTVLSSQTGTGGTLVLYVPTVVLNTTTYNIKVTKQGVCSTDSGVVYHTVFLRNPIAYTPHLSCEPTFNSPYPSGITKVVFGSINNSSGISQYHSYMDYSCCKNTDVIMENTYPISITVDSLVMYHAWVWIDFDGDGNFTGTKELVYSQSGANAAKTFTGNIKIDSTFKLNSSLRMRVSVDASSNSVGSSCYSNYFGEVEDYSITIRAATHSPISKFNFALTPGCTYKATFTDSSYNADTYHWSFGDGTFDSVRTPSPHIYSAPGTYYVRLVTCNQYGCDTLIRFISAAIPQLPVPRTCIPDYPGQCNCTNISGIDFGTIDYWPTAGFTLPQGKYKDLTCIYQTKLIADSTYYIWVYGSNSNGGIVTFWIDYNADGLFSTNERIGSNYGMNGSSLFTSITIPHAPLFFTPLRMSVSIHGYIINTECSSLYTDGYTHDFSVVFYPSSPISFNLTASTALCITNPTITFTNTNKNSSSRIWDFGDGTSDTSATPTHTYASVGNYTVKLRACNYGYCDSVYYLVKVKNLPSSPSISENFGTLTSTAYLGNQWYLNGNVIPGATNQHYITSANGNYTVTYTDSSGCTSLQSTPYLMLSTNVKEMNENSFSLYPNPANEIVYFDCRSDLPKNSFLTIYDMFGRVKKFSEIKSKHLEIDVHALPPGLYVVEIKYGQTNLQQKLRIE
ncbi:MAG: PKD domain-containing protein [Bacteroidetes bacterium]|nr:PKD domain-containing protein [Bacteroidota bacterium]